MTYYKLHEYYSQSLCFEIRPKPALLYFVFHKYLMMWQIGTREEEQVIEHSHGAAVT